MAQTQPITHEGYCDASLKVKMGGIAQRSNLLKRTISKCHISSAQMALHGPYRRKLASCSTNIDRGQDRASEKQGIESTQAVSVYHNAIVSTPDKHEDSILSDACGEAFGKSSNRQFYASKESCFGRSPWSLISNTSPMSSIRDNVTKEEIHKLFLLYIDAILCESNLSGEATLLQLRKFFHANSDKWITIHTIMIKQSRFSSRILEHVVARIMYFLLDEDIRDAVLAELQSFLTFFVESDADTVQVVDAHRIDTVFKQMLGKFKDFLVLFWIKVRKITYPCEFGKKSATLFLCMECHREHM